MWSGYFLHALYLLAIFSTQTLGRSSLNTTEVVVHTGRLWGFVIADLKNIKLFIKKGCIAVGMFLLIFTSCPLLFALALVFSYDFHAGAETMFSRHFNDPAADSYFTKRKWGELLK